VRGRSLLPAWSDLCRYGEESKVTLERAVELAYNQRADARLMRQEAAELLGIEP
jgi:hypothetical protein